MAFLGAPPLSGQVLGLWPDCCRDINVLLAGHPYYYHTKGKSNIPCMIRARLMVPRSIPGPPPLQQKRKRPPLRKAQNIEKASIISGFQRKNVPDDCIKNVLVTWCRRPESNQQPTDYKSVALPLSHAGRRMVGVRGVEPPTSSV